MPPGWARRACCWMAWPCREDGFYDIEAARNAHVLVAREIARREPVRMIAHTDGQGTLLTTEDVVLDERRNPGLSRTDAEEVLRAYLGVEKVIWLTAALEHDNTGGHVDTLACFVAPGLVAALSCADPGDPQFEPLRENVSRLVAAETAAGRRLEAVEISQPERRLDDDGHRISASYINFYIANGAVIVPGFDDPHDEPARETLTRLFPEREVVQLPTTELARVAGNIHCITQQQPLA